MSDHKSRSYVAAAITLGSIAVAMIVRSIIDYQLDERINYATFYVAVIVSALYCGARWGLLSVLLSMTLAVLALPPLGHPAIQELNDLAGLIIFLIVAGVIVWLCDRVREHRRIAEESAKVREELLIRECTARAEAERLNHVKDSFLAAVSHELRTPLQSILGWAQLLRNGNMSDEDVSLALDSIERGVRMQSQLINDLLDLSRISMGKLRLEVRPMALAETLRAAVQTVLPAAKAKNVHLQIECEGMGSVLGDADRLQQVIWNLLSNAIKFTSAGGSVRATLDQDDDSVSLIVADTGEGIDSDFLPRVFDRFQQAAEGKRRREGLGLGLAIVEELVELHGGTIQAHSEGKGQGAEFKVLLPKHRPNAVGVRSAGGSETDSHINEAALAGRQVLIIDDDVDARDVLKSVLGSYGAEVLIAKSAEEARGVLLAYHPDVVTCDLDMPEADGFEFIRSLRTGCEGGTPHPPIVALTACDSDDDRKRVAASGFERHLVKPIGPRELIDALAEVTKSLRRPR
jgi:signal transduction histidine kinase/ActR/RegA family two-component response regulator